MVIELKSNRNPILKNKYTVEGMSETIMWWWPSPGTTALAYSKAKIWPSVF